jgi:hypothetical protein
MMHCPDTPPTDRRATERRHLLERLHRARDEIASLEQALAKLPETAAQTGTQDPSETPLPIAAG